MGFALFAPRRKSGKRMNHGICAFCAKGQKRQKDESWDLHFLRQGAKAAKGWDLHFLRQGAKAAKG